MNSDRDLKQLFKELLILFAVSLVFSAIALLGFFAWFAEDTAGFSLALLARYALLASSATTILTMLLTRQTSWMRAVNSSWQTLTRSRQSHSVHLSNRTINVMRYQRPAASRLSPLAWTLLTILLLGIAPYLVMAVITYGMPSGRSGDVVGPNAFALWIMFGWMVTLPAAGLALWVAAYLGKLEPWPGSLQTAIVGGLVVLPLLPAVLLFFFLYLKL
ncbi:hypothetical protein [Thiolapillus sp.]